MELPCEYAKLLEDRQREHILKPSDYFCEQLLELFKKILRRRGQLHALKKMACAEENHARFQPGTDCREKHKHLIFLFDTPFIHASVRKDMADEGVHGFFTFHRSGFNAYLAYLLQESAKKPMHELDAAMVFWPKNFTREKALESLRNMRPQDAAKDKNRGKLSISEPAHKRWDFGKLLKRLAVFKRSSNTSL